MLTPNHPSIPSRSISQLNQLFQLRCAHGLKPRPFRINGVPNAPTVVPMSSFLYVLPPLSAITNKHTELTLGTLGTLGTTLITWYLFGAHALNDLGHLGRS